MDYGEWEPVIGLEIHVELNTKSKLFSAAPNRFGDEPNTNITEVCTGEPGALPVLNKAAVTKAVQFGCAIGANIAHVSTFDRKSYFYPDTPRNFQITQHESPIITGGSVTVEIDGNIQQFTVHQAHLEDDAGMLKHFNAFAGVDYNRAGVPLLEIVSTPCMHSPKEASAYAMMIRTIMQYLDASDCNMEEGSLRIDANVSVRPKGFSQLRTKTEIKNMNSFSNMELALESEIERHISLYKKTSDSENAILQQTFRWDPELRSVIVMRRKEDAEDYRYFPEPDLLPIVLEPAFIEEIRNSLPELPFDRCQRYIKELSLTDDNAIFLTNDKTLSDYFEAGLPSCNNAAALCNWIIIEFAGRLKDTGKSVIDTGIPCVHIAKLVNMIDNKTITGKIAKSIADNMLATPNKDPETIVKENPDYQPIHDQNEIETLVNTVLEQHPQSVADYKAGKERAFGFLVGQVMKLSRGKASPQIVNQLLKEKLH